ncbi:MAG: cation:proton antiporter [Bacteroidota bacterium]
MDAYIFIIIICAIVIVSFLFNIISKKTNIPSVLMLMALGVGMQKILLNYDFDLDFSSPLEILGIIGLIMIVLEAALDLELRRDKWPVIWKSFTIAFISLVVTSLAISFFIRLFFSEIGFLSAVVYAIPLSVLSSSVIIPSVTNLSSYKKEFLTYEGTFSDILGIMVFYMIVENLDIQGVNELVFAVGGNIIITVAVSVILSYVLLYLIQNIKGSARFFLFLSVLVLLYSVGKMLHLSSLIMILMFGILLRNHKVVLFKQLDDWLNDKRIKSVFNEFNMIINETSFLVRTLFFVVFGMTLPLETLLSSYVWLISGIFLLVSYLLRFLLYYIFEKRNIASQVFIAPRGLISILLFFAIPESLRREGFESGVLFVVIIATGIIMAVSLIATRKEKDQNGANPVAAEAD